MAWEVVFLANLIIAIWMLYDTRKRGYNEKYQIWMFFIGLFFGIFIIIWIIFKQKDIEDITKKRVASELKKFEKWAIDQIDKKTVYQESR